VCSAGASGAGGAGPTSPPRSRLRALRSLTGRRSATSHRAGSRNGSSIELWKRPASRIRVLAGRTPGIAPIRYGRWQANHREVIGCDAEQS
jgi:hypothetical protein